jgi:hypothetical protein
MIKYIIVLEKDKRWTWFHSLESGQELAGACSALRMTRRRGSGRLILGKLEDRLRPNEDSDYAQLLRWRLLSQEQRPVDPYGTITQGQFGPKRFLLRRKPNVFLRKGRSFK